MDPIWTEHRFSGGMLALDVANTVVLRGDPRSFDRFDDAAEIGRFATAASRFRADELGGRRLTVDDPEAVATPVIRLREAADAAVRGYAGTGWMDTGKLGHLAGLCAERLDGAAVSISREQPFGDPSTPLAFDRALAISALALMAFERLERVKICGNCGWLFVDRSRNSSRVWCDMAVCGNRRKAARHYRRRRSDETEKHDA